MSLLGYWDTKETVLTHPGEVSSAKDALANGPKGTIGRGMDAGSIVAKVRGRRVVIALVTPSNRSGYGPLFDGILLEHHGGFGVLRGRFRWTFLHMICFAMGQVGVVLVSVEGLFTGAYRDFGLNGVTASLIAGLFVVAVGLLPHLSWMSRAWKRAIIMEYLGSCGFVPDAPEPQRAK